MHRTDALPAETHRPGRPRNRAADRAILEATLAVLAERGVRAASVDEIAARAHAGKDTIYRRWPHKVDLVHAALDHLEDQGVVAPDTGTLAGDLTVCLAAVGRLLTASSYGRVVTSILAETGHDPGLGARFRDSLAGTRNVIGTILDRAAARGEVPGGPPGDDLLDLLLGPLYYRWLRGQPVDEAWTGDLVRRVLPNGAAASGGGHAGSS